MKLIINSIFQSILFISEAYAKKVWTNHERKSAQAHALEENKEYILPARFDATELPGILPTAGFIDLKSKTPEEFADCIHVKLQQHGVPLTTKPITLGVMGTKGGVGKGTFCSCVSQIFAESEKNVVIIDLDLGSCGTTNDALRRIKVSSTNVKAVFDHFSPFSSKYSNHRGFQNDAMLNITPQYLSSRGLGSIFLLPASDPSYPPLSFHLIADIPSPREERLLYIIKEMIDRIIAQNNNISIILIDCGAGTNPIYSAAFAIADYSYVISTPSSAYFDEVRKIRSIHEQLYPSIITNPISTIINRITCEEDIERSKIIHPKGFIPRMPVLEEHDYSDPIDYDLGYDEFTAAIRNIIHDSFSDTHKTIVPNEIEVRVWPWWTRFVENGLAKRTIHSYRFIGSLLIWLFISVLFAIISTVSLINTRSAISINSPEITSTLHWLNIFGIVLLCITIFTSWKFYRAFKRYLLLLHISKFLPGQKNEQIRLLIDLLNKSGRETIKWIHGLLKRDQDRERKLRSLKAAQ